SSLIKVDLEGNIVQETDRFINPAGFTIHSAIHAAREDAHFVIHNQNFWRVALVF
ncbi:MAG: class II aldolase/adducin family protein, partial [Deltaproteobacteria bacterium]